MRKVTKTKADTRAILADLLQSIQKTNELVVKFALAVENAAKEKPRPVPAAIPHGFPKEIMNIKEAAEYTGYSVAYIYQLTAQGEMPFCKPMGGKKGKLFFSRSELDIFMRRGKRDAGYERVEKAAAILNGETE
jgi:excisionase family DNA binding protein